MRYLQRLQKISMAFQFIVGVSVGFAGSVFLTHHIRDRMNLSSLVVEKKLDKKMVELKYQKVSFHL